MCRRGGEPVSVSPADAEMCRARAMLAQAPRDRCGPRKRAEAPGADRGPARTPATAQGIVRSLPRGSHVRHLFCFQVWPLGLVCWSGGGARADSNPEPGSEPGPLQGTPCASRNTEALLVSCALFSESHEIVTAHRAFSRSSHLGVSLLTQRPISPALARGRTVTAVGWATAGLQAGHGARPGDLGRPE